MNLAFRIVLLFILLNCVTNQILLAQGCHIPLTAFYRPVKALLRQSVKTPLQ